MAIRTRLIAPENFCALTLAMLVALVLALPAAAAAPAPAAATPPTAAQELDELEEIIVRGRRAAIAIADLEDDFYKRYNMLNRDDRYDMHCSYLNTDPDNAGSRILSRVCMPGYVTEAMVQWSQGRCDNVGFTALDQNKDSAVSMTEAAAESQLLNQFMDLDRNMDYRLTYLEYNERTEAIPTQCYQPPPPEAVLVAGTRRWYEHMMRVTASDARLLAMSSDLGGLYYELNTMQRRYTKLEADIKARKRTERSARNPR